MRLLFVVLVIVTICKKSGPDPKCLPGYIEPSPDTKPKPGKDDPEPEPEPDPEEPTEPILDDRRYDYVPTGGCTCAEEFHPTNCTCPETAEKIKLLDKETCDCLPSKDPRAECFVEQIIPELPFNLLKYIYEDGTVIVDETNEDALYNKADLNTIRPYYSNSSKGESFIFIQEYQFKDLIISQNIGRDISHCPVIHQFKQDWMFGLMGLAVYANKRLDIAPSIVYVADHMPSYIKIQPWDIEPVQMIKGCGSDPLLLIYSFLVNGIVSSSCIPNFVPNIEGENRLIPNWCIDDTQILPNLEGFRIGYNKSLKNEVLKEDIVRVGPVLGTIQRYNYDGDCERSMIGDPITAIFIGWETDQQRDENWIVAIKKDEVVEYGSVSQIETTYELSRIPFITDDANDVEIDITFIYFQGAYIQPVTKKEQPDDSVPPQSLYTDFGKSGSEINIGHSIWTITIYILIPLFILLV